MLYVSIYGTYNKRKSNKMIIKYTDKTLNVILQIMSKLFLNKVIATCNRGNYFNTDIEDSIIHTFFNASLVMCLHFINIHMHTFFRIYFIENFFYNFR